MCVWVFQKILGIQWNGTSEAMDEHGNVPVLCKFGQMCNHNGGISQDMIHASKLRIMVAVHMIDPFWITSMRIDKRGHVNGNN